MERLTNPARLSCGNAVGSQYLMLTAESNTDLVERVFSRLADYEDSGLTPERVQELADAERDGRLVVLPCKFGDVVYVIAGDAIAEMRVGNIFPSGFIVKNKLCNLYLTATTGGAYSCAITSEIGKTVFLTRAEAEAALQEKEM